MKLKKLNKLSRFKYVLPVSLVFLVIVCSIVLSTSIFAEGTGDAGNDGGSSATNPTNCGTQTIGHCNGGGWTYWSWPKGHHGDLVIPDVKGSGYAFYGGKISGECEEVGGFWRSSWFRKGNSNDLVGLAPNKYWSVNKFHISYPYYYNKKAGAASISEVHKDFDIAVRRGVVPKGTTWENVSWFCSDRKDEPEDTESDKKPLYGDTGFFSTSTVEVFDPDITGGKKVTTSPDGTATVKFSTDESSVTVEFSHNLYYQHGSFSMVDEVRERGHTRDTTSNNTVNTTWNVTGTYGVGNTNWGGIRPNKDTNTTPATAKQHVTFDFGDSYGTKKKCSEINYNHKKAHLTGTYICDLCIPTLTGCACVLYHYDYTAEYKDSGGSKVCVEVTRPDPPSGNPKNPGGDINSKVMFAGEDSEIWWDGIYASSYETRRLSGWKSILFEIDQIPDYNADKVGEKLATDSNSKLDPCEMYANRFGTHRVNCVPHESESWNTKDTSLQDHSYGKNGGIKIDVKVPDYVGHKYCNSFGYSFEYWYGIKLDNNPIGWTHDTPKDYWYNFGAACRTIAKKPTTASWNGGVKTMGNIPTPVAERHNNINFGELADNNRTLYGSWSEYLVAANTNLNPHSTIASGSTLSNGSSILSLCNGTPWNSNSPLTISNFALDSNVCSLTASGITANTSFLTRLNAYLRDVQDNPNITHTNNVAELYNGVKGNTVLTVNGDLKIEQNIVIDDSIIHTLRDIPQAIIFVNNGNLNISENVERIDAWIIVTGSNGTGIINTCDGFNPGTNIDVTSDGAGFLGNRCTKQLVFNGPVIARTINLQRSYGSDYLITRTGSFGNTSSKQTPAEIFNLRADAYLWGYAQASRYGSSYGEAYSRELAPRY